MRPLARLLAAVCITAAAPLLAQSQVESQDLQQVFASALESSPRLNIARAQLDAGEAQKNQARGQLLPQITLNGSFSDNRQTVELNSGGENRNTYDGEKYTLQLRQTLFNWRAFAARSRAALVLDQREAEYYGELGWLLVDVSEKYLDVLEAENTYHTVVAELEATDKQLQQVQRLYERQLTKITDLLEVKARVASVEADKIDAANALALAKEALWEVSGTPIDQLYQLNPVQAALTIEGEIETWVTRGLAQNPYLKARNYAARAAKKRISEQRGTYLPSVTLIAQQQKSDIGYENAATPRTDTTYVGVDVTIPLFAGGSNRASVREAIAQAEIAKSEEEQVRREITKRVRAAYLNLEASVKRVEASQRLVESTAKASAAMRKGVQVGTVTVIDQLNALRDEYAAQRDLLRARYEHIKAFLLLKREAGIVGSEDLQRVNALLVAPEETAIGVSNQAFPVLSYRP